MGAWQDVPLPRPAIEIALKAAEESERERATQ